MFTSPEFFEPYNNVYGYLQNFNVTKFPFKQFIIDGTVSFFNGLKNFALWTINTYWNFDILCRSCWPSNELVSKFLHSIFNIFVFSFSVLQTEPAIPQYINLRQQYKYKELSFFPIKKDPPKNLPLSVSQRQAYANALINNLCLIQGPPGKLLKLFNFTF